MADNKKKRGGADRGLIALSEPYEVAYWSKKFKITPAKLKAAVQKAGHSAKKVEAYIKLQKHKAAEPGTDRDEPALRSQLLVEEVQGHPRQIEGRRRRRRAFVQSGRRPSRQGQGAEEGEEERQQGSPENDKETRKEKGRLAAAFSARLCVGI